MILEFNAEHLSDKQKNMTLEQLMDQYNGREYSSPLQAFAAHEAAHRIANTYGITPEAAIIEHEEACENLQDDLYEYLVYDEYALNYAEIQNMAEASIEQEQSKER